MPAAISTFLKKPVIHCTAVIFLCFLLTSTGYLSWTYHLAGQVPAGTLEVMTMVAGYLLQALGIGVFSAIIRLHPNAAARLFYAALPIHMILMVPAVLSSYLAGTLAFGFLMNTACGFIAGYYLHILACTVSEQHRASSFGTGYGLAILVTWLLSLIRDGSVYHTAQILLIFCAVLTAVSFGVVYQEARTADLETPEKTPVKTPVKDPENIPQAQSSSSNEPGRNLPVRENTLILVFFLVFLFSLVNSSSFSFPYSDIGNTVSVELSRLVYAAGLMIAGFVTDRNRKYGAISALTALVIPFIMLALQGEPVSAPVFWALSYFTSGFYSVCRIILFSDLASGHALFFLSGAGLMIGRIGDALGEGISLSMKDHLLALVALTALLFVATVLVFFRVYHDLYIPEPARPQSEQERFEHFAVQHDLSLREREVLRLIFDQKTNAEIAGALNISQNTVKFHVRNLMQKTGCKNRKELFAEYLQS